MTEHGITSHNIAQVEGKLKIIPSPQKTMGTVF
jgi:hypothetical protein